MIYQSTLISPSLVNQELCTGVSFVTKLFQLKVDCAALVQQEQQEQNKLAVRTVVNFWNYLPQIDHIGNFEGISLRELRRFLIKCLKCSK